MSLEHNLDKKRNHIHVNKICASYLVDSCPFIPSAPGYHVSILFPTLNRLRKPQFICFLSWNIWTTVQKVPLLATEALLFSGHGLTVDSPQAHHQFPAAQVCVATICLYACGIWFVKEPSTHYQKREMCWAYSRFKNSVYVSVQGHVPFDRKTKLFTNTCNWQDCATNTTYELIN